MRPKGPAEDGEEDLFRSRLASILDPRHALLRLAALIDWTAFDAAFGPPCAEVGRGPACRRG
jgi:transposase, IS5 family